MRDGLSEVLAGVLGSVVALESQARAVRLGHCDSLHYRLDGDIVGGHGVELVGQPFSGEYVHHVEAVAPSVHLAAPDVCDVSLPELVGSGGLRLDSQLALRHDPAYCGSCLRTYIGTVRSTTAMPCASPVP